MTTEQEMRDTEVPWPKTEEELVAYVHDLVERPHDYGTCVYAMSMAAEAAFNYVASKLGTTGFQAGFAELDFLKRTRGLTAFRIVSFDDIYYPQYWVSELEPLYLKYVAENRAEVAAKAKELLAGADSFVHPEVRGHWMKLAAA